MAVTDEMLAIAEEVKPVFCCLVPEKREELTTEGGLDVVENFENIKAACERLANANILVSLFIDADKAQIDAAAACSAHTLKFLQANTQKPLAKKSSTKSCAFS